jgi:hypothetical protein
MARSAPTTSSSYQEKIGVDCRKSAPFSTRKKRHKRPRRGGRIEGGGGGGQLLRFLGDFQTFSESGGENEEF